jgi:nucleotide-binding universal stress UspA family protein
MKKILIATDGSETSRAALEAGFELAEEEGAEVVVAHVASLLDFVPHRNGGEDAPPDRFPTSDWDPVLCEAMELAESRGVKARPELLVGYPPKQILRLASELEADLIVVGSRGLGRVKSAILGSTSRDVLARAGRPVLVVRDSATHAAVTDPAS